MHSDPQMTVNRFSGTQFRVADWMHFVCGLRAKKSRSGARYCSPSQEYLAVKFGVCRATINRAIGGLWRVGVINKVRRRRKAGHWSTNLYTMRNWPVWGAVRFLRVLKAVDSRVTPKLHIDPPQGGNLIKTSARPSAEVVKAGFDLIYQAIGGRSPVSEKK